MDGIQRWVSGCDQLGDEYRKKKISNHGALESLEFKKRTGAGKQD